MNRRTLLKGLVATAAGILVPGEVLAEPTKRIWQLDRTMVGPRQIGRIDFPDDTAYIEWLINDATSRGDWAFIPKGTYSIDRTIRLPDYAKVNGQGSTFRAGDSFEEGSLFIMGTTIR